jgi:hypothetical protein
MAIVHATVAIVISDDISAESETDGITKSEYSVFVKALTASLQLNNSRAQFGQAARRR